MNTSKVRFAVIGAGNRGVGISKVITQDYSSEAALTVVCDVNPAAANKAKETCGFTAVESDVLKAIARDDVDAVLVTTPPGLHRDAVVAAARAKKHVLCEKPFAVELADADAMIAECNKSKVVLSVAYFYRFAENRSTLRQLLQRGVIGRPVFWREALPLYAEGQRWLADPKLGGGALFEYSHSMDFACHTFGKPKWVFAQMMKFDSDPNWKTHDSYNVVIRFESGDTYQISGFGCVPMNYAAPEPFWGTVRYRQNDIVGPSGHVFTGEISGKRQMIVTENLGAKDQRVTRHAWDGSGGFTTDPTPALVRDFLDCIRERRQSLVISAQSARQTLAIVQAALESSRKEEKVLL